MNSYSNYNESLTSNFSKINLTGSTTPSFSQSQTSIIIRIIAYLIIFIVAFVGNLLVIITLAFSRRTRTVTNTFLINLAISDLLLGIFCMPFTLIGSIQRNFIFGAAMCKLIPYFQAISVGVSGWTLVAISLERYFAICHPLKSRKWQTLSHSYRIICLIWILNLIIMSPIAFLSQLLPTRLEGKYKCREVWSSTALEQLFNIFLDIILLVIPFLIMVVTYAKISKTLYSSEFLSHKLNRNQCIRLKEEKEDTLTNGDIDDNSSQEYTLVKRENSFSTIASVIYDNKTGNINVINFQSYGSLNKKINVEQKQINHQMKTKFRYCKKYNAQVLSKKRVIRMLCILVLEFFLCWTPIFVINTWTLYDPKQVYYVIGPTTISFIHLLSYISSCSNPITYCFMHKKFREALLMMIRSHTTKPAYVLSEMEPSTSNQYNPINI